MDETFEIAIYKGKKDLCDTVKQMRIGQYRVGTVKNLGELYQRMKSGEVLLLLYDANMDEQKWNQGIKTLSRIRKEGNIPIIVVSSVKQDFVKIIALNSGADDYVERDCNPLELSARIASQLRRYCQLKSKEQRPTESYRIGGLEMDANRRIVSVDGQEVNLTPTEYEIIRLLMKNRRKTFSNEEIYESIWKMPAINVENTIAVHMNHIRGKIEPDPKNPMYLKVIWGVGYKME